MSSLTLGTSEEAEAEEDECGEGCLSHLDGAELVPVLLENLSRTFNKYTAHSERTDPSHQFCTFNFNKVTLYRLLHRPNSGITLASRQPKT